MTAKEFLKKEGIKHITPTLFNEHNVTWFMREFAIHHVQEALKAAAENVDFDHEEIEHGSDDQVYFDTVHIDEKTILNAYPLRNIK